MQRRPRHCASGSPMLVNARCYRHTAAQPTPPAALLLPARSRAVAGSQAPLTPGGTVLKAGGFFWPNAAPTRLCPRMCQSRSLPPLFPLPHCVPQCPDSLFCCPALLLGRITRHRPLLSPTVACEPTAGCELRGKSKSCH